MKETEHSQSIAALPLDLQEMLADLPERIHRDRMDAMVVRLCSWRACSFAEIARWLGRSENYMRSIMGRVVGRGLVRRNFRGSLSHPQQTFSTIDTASTCRGVHN